jgi:TolB-like protein/class 3 adenylate cyclase
MERKLTTILAADVVGYSGLMERDEAGTHERLTTGRKELFEPEIARHHGHIFKLMGDGMLAEFGSVVDAVECAVSLQRGLTERNAAVPEDQRIQVRIGINLGEVIVEGGDRFGEGVNIAARLEQLADPGGICVSGKVAKEVEKKLAFGFEPMGEQKVKNIAEPIQAFRVKLDGTPVKRMVPVLPKRTLPWAAGLAVAVAVLAAVWFALPKPAHRPEALATIPSIAVLPFDNIGNDPALNYFGDGVAEDIITMLARIPDLAVIARNSSFTYKGKATDVRVIGRDLGVDYVLEGSVRKEADKVRIVAQLVNAKTGQHVWAEQFDKTGTDPWALQDEVTGKIIGALTGARGQLKRAQYRNAWGKDAANLEEYDYYLRGHDVFMQFTPEGNRQAGQIWEQGLKKFPDSALLQVKLGIAHNQRALNGWSENTAADFQRAGELVRQALGHPNLSPLEKRLCYWTTAFINLQKGKFDQALTDAETARNLAPYDAFMIGDLSSVLLMSGKPMQAVEWLEFAATRDPANAAYYNGLKGWALEVAGKPEESLASLNAGMLFAGFDHFYKAIVLVRLGRDDEAKAELKKGLEINPAITQTKWREINFYSDPKILDNEVTDLAKAGLRQN